VSGRVRRCFLSVGTCLARSALFPVVFDEVGLLSVRVRRSRDRLGSCSAMSGSVGKCSVMSAYCRHLFDKVGLVLVLV